MSFGKILAYRNILQGLQDVQSRALMCAVTRSHGGSEELVDVVIAERPASSIRLRTRANLYRSGFDLLT